MEHDTLLLRQLRELTQGVPYETANLANAAALLWLTLPDINWVGFYKMTDGALVLGPFQGKPACVRIEMGRGVCGRAAAEDRSQLVPDVHLFPGHIACDSASRSEVVIPLHSGGAVWGVLDIDSPTAARFSSDELAALERFARGVEEFL